MRPTAKEARISADLLRLMIEEPHIPSRSLNSISCPTTIMVGQFDAIDPQETRRIVNAIPRSRLVVVEGADHVLPKCAPERVTDELFALIARAESENK
jgi:pimeloyl-ACP methyl ester carboxylesterase